MEPSYRAILAAFRGRTIVTAAPHAYTDCAPITSCCRLSAERMVFMVTSGSLSNRPLRPLTMGGIWSAALQLYRQNFLPLVGIVAIVQVAVAILLALVALTGLNATSRPSSASIVSLVVVGLLSMLFFIVATFLQSGALTLAIADDYLGQPITIERAYAAAGRRLGALIGTSLLAGLAIFLMMAVVSVVAFGLGALTHAGVITVIIGLAGIVGIAYFVLGWAFVGQTVMLEQLSGVGALRRCTELVAGYWWRTFGVLLLTGIVVGIVAFVVEAVLGAIVRHGFLGGLVNLIVEILLAPFYSAVITLLYFDLRVRKEQLTHETLIGHMSGGPAVSGGLSGMPSV